MSDVPRPVVLVVMDGWGYRTETFGNAAQGHTPNLDRLYRDYPATLLAASGEAVGLPEGLMGNSEVGHTNLGAGFVVYQQQVRINKAIADGDFFTNPVLLDAAAHVTRNGSALHICGLVSPGGVHSASPHLYALLTFARQQNIARVYVHVFTDGRDTLPRSARPFVAELQAQCDTYGARIASVSGRYYAMDRDNRWERVEQAYRAITEGVGEAALSADAAIEQSYAADKSDEFIQPTVITDAGRPVATLNDGDGLIFLNFRADRARELTRAFVLPDFDGFPRHKTVHDLAFVTMTQYESGLPVQVAYDPIDVPQPVAQVVSAAGLHQYHIVETEKYAHVTYFFNGGNEAAYPNEDRELVPSPKVATYDLKPEMSAREITAALIRRIETKQDDFIIVNFANFDMVGHTGVFDATVTAAGVVDGCVQQVIDATLPLGGVLLLTADHGNAEQKIDSTTSGPLTEHTTNPVQCILVAPDASPYRRVRLRDGQKLAAVAPTILDLLALTPPPDMRETSLIERL